MISIKLKVLFFNLVLSCFVDLKSFATPIGPSSTPNYKGIFWQITDIHWDMQYSITGDATKMCHNNYSSPNVNNGKYGNYLCDSPWALVKNALQTMVEIESAPDFVLWTGDNVPHVDPQPDFDVIFRTVNNITTELRTAFQESIPVLPVLGNHDAFPKDYYPIAGEEFYGQYLTEGGWSLVLAEDEQEDFKRGGFYEHTLSTGVTVLILNTNLYYAPNKLRQNVTDPCGQFAWMREKLQKAKDQDYKVIVSAHAPPGYFERHAENPFFSADYNDVYVDLLNEFGDVLMAQIYGHEHTDSFKLFSTTDGDVKSVGFLSPSVTPWYPAPVKGGTPVNPSLRLYSYNTTTLLDYTQYHFNLSDSNTQTERSLNANEVSREPKWEEFYQVREMYGLESLDVKSMTKLYKMLVADDKLFQAYYLANSAGYNNGICDADCKKAQLCAMANIRIEDLKTCMGDDHSEGKLNHSSFTPTHLSHGHNFVIEDGFPVSDDSAGAPYFVVILVTLGMTLMVILTVTLGALLVNMVFRRRRLLRQDGGVQVSDLTFGLRPKGYNPF